MFYLPMFPRNAFVPALSGVSIKCLLIPVFIPVVMCATVIFLGLDGCSNDTCEDNKKTVLQAGCRSLQSEHGYAHTHILTCSVLAEGSLRQPSPNFFLYCTERAWSSKSQVQWLPVMLGYSGSGCKLQSLLRVGFMIADKAIYLPLWAEVLFKQSESSERLLALRTATCDTCCVVGKAFDGDLPISWWGHACVWLLFGCWPNAKCANVCPPGFRLSKAGRSSLSVLLWIIIVLGGADMGMG